MKLKFAAGMMLACFTIVITSCQNDETIEKDKSKVELKYGGSTFVNAKEVLNLLENESIKSKIYENSINKNNFRGIGGESDDYDLYFEKFDLADYYSYTLYVSEYTVDHPYDLFFVVTVDKKDNSEKACYLKYTPDDGSIPFNIRKFTGKLEILNLEHDVQGVLPFSNGTASETDNVTVTEECTTTVLVTEVPCSHGGNHGVGETCNPPFINDAYYSVNVLTECHNNYTYNGPSTFIGGYGGGSGGGSSHTPYLTAKQVFTNSLTPSQQAYMISNPSFASSIYYFLELKGYANGTVMAKEIINASINNTLISPFPFFKYPPGSIYTTVYPKLTEYLKNKMPLLKNNQYIINKLKQYSELSEERIITDLVWGQGPTIYVEQLNGFCADCDEDTYGVFKASQPDRLYIDIDFVVMLENSEPGPQGNALAFLLGVTILHEYVHLGDNEDGEDQEGEEGIQFEEATYGESVWLNNAGDILIKWEGN